MSNQEKPTAVGGLTLWTVVHTYRHGTSYYPILSIEAPDVEEIAASDPDTFELDRDDEYLEVEGQTPLLNLFTNPEFPLGNLDEIRQALAAKGVTSDDLSDLVNTFFATLAKAINEQGFDTQVTALTTIGLLPPR